MSLDEVRAVWNAVNREHDRSVAWMYRHADGTVRVGIGHILERVEDAFGLRWQGIAPLPTHVGRGLAAPSRSVEEIVAEAEKIGLPSDLVAALREMKVPPHRETDPVVVLPRPTEEEAIRADWERVAAMPPGLLPEAYYVKGALMLTESEIDALCLAEFEALVEEACVSVDGFAELPTPAQLGLLSLAWRGKAIDAEAVRRGDWALLARASDESSVEHEASRAAFEARAFASLAPVQDAAPEGAPAEAT